MMADEGPSSSEWAGVFNRHTCTDAYWPIAIRFLLPARRCGVLPPAGPSEFPGLYCVLPVPSACQCGLTIFLCIPLTSISYTKRTSCQPPDISDTSEHPGSCKTR
ncbi:hypothetical protein Y1Q_0014679 [Alligator mississippiensis]|nr:hypothetical protein Y1Q_0014679 [Alligator mississippiensis]